MSDRKLVELLLANDAEAIEYVFFYRCEGMFAHIVNTILRSQEKKEELITEFYLYLSSEDWRRLRQFEFRSALDTLLTIVAVRYFKEKKASEQNRTVEMFPQYLNEAKKEFDDFDVINELSRVELYEAIEHLKNARERCVLLGVLMGKNAEEIASEMGCSAIAIYNLTKKAKEALKKMMKGKEK